MEKFARHPRLVGLKMPHQVPGCAQISKRKALGHRFLHAVFAKIAQPRRKCRTNQFGWMSLGNGHQSYILTPASAAPAGSSDSLFDPRDVFSNVRDHLSRQTQAWRSHAQIFQTWQIETMPFYHSRYGEEAPCYGT